MQKPSRQQEDKVQQDRKWFTLPFLGVKRWDWLSLIVTPLISVAVSVTAAVWVLRIEIDNNQRALEENFRQQTLRNYIQQIQNLVVEYDLGTGNKDFSNSEQYRRVLQTAKALTSTG